MNESDIGKVEYRDVPGWPGYRVGSDGSVWSRRLKGRYADRLAKNWKQIRPTWIQKSPNYGQLFVRLGGNGRQTFHVGCLILSVFVGPRPVGFECCHQDGNTRNNAVTNLRWGTSAENGADRARHGRMAKGEDNHKAKLTANDVRKIRRQIAHGTPKRVIAANFGVRLGTICFIAAGKTWRHVA